MPNPLRGKNILLGVTGSIAAYKAADLASKLHQEGAIVEVILTTSALQFITPLTFQSVTGRKAYTDADLWAGEGHVTHVGLGRAADMILIAPASANTIAKLAHGISDNLLTVTVLAATCPLLIAPAMDAGMYQHPATSDNIAVLQKRGAYFIGPAAGHLASGLVGVGRMSEPQEICNQARWTLSAGGPLMGKKIVVTAGGTQEPIDPVRIITNRSSGKQGIALAQAALDAGAEVVLISAATQSPVPVGARLTRVRTAAEMLQAVLDETETADTLIMVAAVADFRPSDTAGQKIKKEQGLKAIPLEPTADILKTVQEKRKRTGFPGKVVGFAAESQNTLENAAKKLAEKGVDLMIANDISAPNAGFEVDTNQVTFLYPDGSQKKLANMPKSEVAEHIIAQVIAWL
ncbi:MAG: bifunctional phosphopantothenoylcysteine decarboxylase/phosphopantothenate--cysteine ligase CoaBC [Anaerolineaceae bacterium]|nr:bifunctional phosphopantothenoylcysteine decarboxylase/phosphopantothenate--cysteine ligase CoaBC [Anaerolineaceae bacterium]